MDKKEMALKAMTEMKRKTEVPAMKFALDDENKPGIFDSKVGGMGYAPHNGEFPVDSKGNQLRLLAQINCSEVDLEEYPKSGLLQFWVLDDDVVGMDFDDGTNQDTFRIVYYADIDKTVTEEELKAKYHPYEFEKDFFCVYGEFAIKFEKGTDSISVYSSSEYFDGSKLFVKTFNEMYPEHKINDMDDLGLELDELEETLNIQNFGHKIGGYPAFTQWDPRSEGDPHDFVLFQLDSDYGKKDLVMWGDSGICNFFINKEKLKNLDFTDVIYNWDCY